MITDTELGDTLHDLKNQYESLKANLNAVSGAIQLAENLLTASTAKANAASVPTTIAQGTV